jgi:hypothetical protein
MFEDLGQRTAVEEAFLRAFSKSNATVVPSLPILVPTREWTDEEIFPLLEREKLDAVLMIHQTAYYYESQYVPERVEIDRTDYLSATSFRRRPAGRVRSYGTVRRYGGYYVDMPRLQHELRLYDVASRRTAWLPTAFTRSDSAVSYAKLVESVAVKTQDQLAKDGLVESHLPAQVEDD